MDDDFLLYFERELAFIREMGAEFAGKYPKIAGRLMLEPDRCEDPHVERLIEAFALLCARIHKKLDDGFPRITQSLLNVLYPHYTSPIPSMSIVQFSPLLKNVPEGGYLIPKGTTVFSKPVDGIPCRFATAYPVTLRPMEVVRAEISEPKLLVKNAQQAITIRLKLHNGVTFSRLQSGDLTFFLHGQLEHVCMLYELLLSDVCHVECVSVGTAVASVTALGAKSISPVGFEEGEALFPYPSRSFPGYRHLFEYFSFPEKYFFFKIDGLSALADGDFGPEMDIVVYLDKRPKQPITVTSDTFRLHCTPVANAFKRVAEPIRVEPGRSEYRVIPDLRRADAWEVLSIDRVIASTASSEAKEYRPFYSISHHDRSSGQSKECYWHAQRRASGRIGDRGSEVFLSFCDLGSSSTPPAEETVTVHVTCSNRDLPCKIALGDPAGEFDTETAAPLQAITALIKPTSATRLPLEGALQWRLISHLSLNYLSLLEGGGDALREIVALYDFQDSHDTRKQVRGIVSVTSRPVTARMGPALVRGIEVTIEFDEENYVGSSILLFASVLERFLGQYVSINSFVQTIVKTVQSPTILKKWPPRNGDRVLL